MGGQIPREFIDLLLAKIDLVDLIHIRLPLQKKSGNNYFARLEFCTDNGAMIAYAGSQHLLRGEREPLAVEAFARWSLE